MSRILVDRLLHLMATVFVVLALAACNGGTGGGGSSAAVLTSIQVSPVSQSSGPVGSAASYQAFGVYSDDSKVDITSTVTWHSSNDAVVVISNNPGTKGYTTAVAPGSASISASISGVTSNSSPWATLEGTVTSIALSPTSLSSTLVLNQEVKFSVTAYLSNGTSYDATSTAIFNSTTAGIVSFSNYGIVEAIAIGNTEVYATLTQGTNTFTSNKVGVIVSGDNPIVALHLSANTSSVPLGVKESAIATAYGIKANGESAIVDLTWTVESSGIARVTPISNGSAAYINGESQLGSTKVIATYGSGSSAISASIPFSVTNATISSISLICDTTALPIGESTQCAVIAKFSNNSFMDVTSGSTITFTPANAAVGVSPSGIVKFNTGGDLVAGNAFIFTATYNSSLGNFTSNTAAITASNPTLDHIEIVIDNGNSAAMRAYGEPFNVYTGDNFGTYLTAYAIFTDGSRLNWTHNGTWSLSDEATDVAVIGNNTSDAGYVRATLVGEEDASVPFNINFVSTTGESAVSEFQLVARGIGLLGSRLASNYSITESLPYDETATIGMACATTNSSDAYFNGNAISLSFAACIGDDLRNTLVTVYNYASVVNLSKQDASIFKAYNINDDDYTHEVSFNGVAIDYYAHAYETNRYDITFESQGS